jgi:hypothetical protein
MVASKHNITTKRKEKCITVKLQPCTHPTSHTTIVKYNKMYNKNLSAKKGI